MYQISKLTGRIYSSSTSLEIIQDDRLQEWKDYTSWLKLGNSPIEVEGTSIEVAELAKAKAENNEFQLYLKRKADGENAYLKISAEFRVLKLSGVITEETHQLIEDHLKPVRNEVMFGQWKDALRLLEDLGTTPVGAELYDRLHFQISNYISENYQ